MFYFLYGKDKEKARQKAHELIGILLKKRPGAEVLRMDGEHFGGGKLEELISSQSLFEHKYIVFADTLFESNDAKETVVQKAKEIQASPNAFVLLEGAVDKSTAAKLEKHAEKTFLFEGEKRQGRKFGMGTTNPLSLGEFNIFSMTDAFGRKDRKGLWVLYQRSILHHVPPEEVHGILFWQVRAMAAAAASENAGKAGLNPFVYSKSKEFLKNFPGEELQKLSSRLVSLYHDSRRGIHELNIALERFILGL